MDDIVWQKATIACLVYVSVVGQVFSPNIISAGVVVMRVSGYPLSMRFVLNCKIAVLNATQLRSGFSVPVPLLTMNVVK